MEKDSDEEPLLVTALSQLTDYQREIYEQCIKTSSKCICAPMGAGKTIIGISVALTQSKGPILIILSKTLISVWEDEIHKFFGDKLSYSILHTLSNKNKVGKKKKMSEWEWDMFSHSRVILVPVDTLRMTYSHNNIKPLIAEPIRLQRFPWWEIKYKTPRAPLLNTSSGSRFLYSMKWDCILIDEIQDYTEIEIDRCKSIGSLCAIHRWALSGTPFNEPKPSRILGYNYMLNAKHTPRTLARTESFIRDPLYVGYRETMIVCQIESRFNTYKIRNMVISHVMELEERKIYECIRIMISDIRKYLRRSKEINDTEAVKKITGYLLAIIIILRQCLICPLIPLADMAIKMFDYKQKTELASIFNQHIQRINIDNYLNDPDSISSSRIRNLIEILNSRSGEKIVVFSTFASCLRIVNHCITKDTDRKTFFLSDTSTLTKRKDIIDKFKESSDGVLLLTYKIGSNGLNLQCAHICVILDLWWNKGITDQSIARIARRDQESEYVDVYLLTSDTGMERALIKKQTEKTDLLNELATGPSKKKVSVIKMDEILDIIESDVNKKSLSRLYQ